MGAIDPYYPNIFYSVSTDTVAKRCQNSHMTLINWLFVGYILVSIGIVAVLEQEKVLLRLALNESYRQLGYKEEATDGDNDGVVQDGTKWARKVSKKTK
jgi:hypothetical protein